MSLPVPPPIKTYAFTPIFLHFPPAATLPFKLRLASDALASRKGAVTDFVEIVEHEQ